MRTAAPFLSTDWALRLVAIGLLLLMSATASAQELKAEVDRRTISLNDTVTLTLRKSGRTLQGGPDFEPLRRHFDVLSNQRSHQMRIVNGDMQSWTEWRLTLSPKKAGTLIIPAFEFEGEQSQPLEITVEERQRDPERSGEELFIETELSKDSVYVQEQLLFTVRLYSQVNLDGAEMEPLEFDNAMVTTVDENNFIRDIDNRQHLVLEATFAIFPQESGTLEIPSRAYEVALSRGQRGPWGGNTRKRLRTESRQVEVRPTPSEFDGSTWLPARSLRLSEHWSKDPNNLKQGEPVTRRITLEAEGLAAAQLPELLLPQTDGVTFYPDRPQTDEKTSPAGLQSTSTYTVAMVPNDSGRMTLPPIEVKWWDTQANKMRTAEIPETQIQVEATPGSRPERQSNEGGNNDDRRDREDDGQASPGSLSGQGEPSGWNLWHGVLLALTLALLALCLWLAYTGWRLKQELNAIHDLHREDFRRERIAQSQAWQAIKQAAQKNDLKQLRQALLVWAQTRWPEDPPQGLTDIGQRIGSDRLRSQLAELDAALFRGNTDADFDAKALVKELNQWRVSHRSRSTPDSGLKPLYRNSQ